MQRATRLITTIAWAAIPLALTVVAGVWFVSDPGLRRDRNPFDSETLSLLLRRPESIEELATRRSAQKARERMAPSKMLERSDELLGSRSPSAGNPYGDVTLVEFFDYNCSYCRQMAPVIARTLEDPELRVVYKELPLLGSNSKFAARATLAAAKQDKYLPLHEALLSLHGSAGPESVMRAAERSGLDTARLKKDMNSADVSSELDRNFALARALRIDGTPGFVIGQRVQRGAVDFQTLVALIRDARADQRRNEDRFGG